MLAEALRECLEQGDVHRLRCIWAQASPHLPQPKNREEATVALHQARTAAESVTTGKRQYSHVWLTERGFKSDLPDDLKTKAEQLGRPVLVDSVGVSVNVMSPVIDRQERGAAIQGAMETVVSEMYADGDNDPLLVKPRMMQAREKIRRM